MQRAVQFFCTFLFYALFAIRYTLIGFGSDRFSPFYCGESNSTLYTVQLRYMDCQVPTSKLDPIAFRLGCILVSLPGFVSACAAFAGYQRARNFLDGCVVICNSIISFVMQQSSDANVSWQWDMAKYLSHFVTAFLAISFGVRMVVLPHFMKRADRQRGNRPIPLATGEFPQLSISLNRIRQPFVNRPYKSSQYSPYSRGALVGMERITHRPSSLADSRPSPAVSDFSFSGSTNTAYDGVPAIPPTFSWEETQSTQGLSDTYFTTSDSPSLDRSSSD